MKPRISVLMPVYNAEKYVGLAIESILTQTYENFEFIIIDDNSSDQTYNTITQYKDKRIRIIRNSKNLGTAETLNKGLTMCNAEYIIRMDADDISKPYRLEKQLSFMDQHPEISISGSHMELINREGILLKEQKKAIGFENIKIGLFFGKTSLAHPSLIIRKSMLNKYKLCYDSAFQYAEDYDLYCRASRYIKFDNYPESLIQYRIHADSVSQKFSEQQILDAQSALYLHLRRLRFPFSLDDFRIHTFCAFPPKSWNAEKKEQFTVWLGYLETWNKTNKLFDIQLFSEFCETTSKKILQKETLQ